MPVLGDIQSARLRRHTAKAIMNIRCGPEAWEVLMEGIRMYLLEAYGIINSQYSLSLFKNRIQKRVSIVCIATVCEHNRSVHPGEWKWQFIRLRCPFQDVTCHLPKLKCFLLVRDSHVGRCSLVVCDGHGGNVSRFLIFLYSFHKHTQPLLAVWNRIIGVDESCRHSLVPVGISQELGVLILVTPLALGLQHLLRPIGVYRAFSHGEAAIPDEVKPIGRGQFNI